MACRYPRCLCYCADQSGAYSVIIVAKVDGGRVENEADEYGFAVSADIPLHASALEQAVAGCCCSGVRWTRADGGGILTVTVGCASRAVRRTANRKRVLTWGALQALCNGSCVGIVVVRTGWTRGGSRGPCRAVIPLWTAALCFDDDIVINV